MCPAAISMRVLTGKSAWTDRLTWRSTGIRWPFIPPETATCISIISAQSMKKPLFITGPPSWCHRVQCGTQSNASGGSASDVPKITGRSQTYLQLLPSHNRSPGPGVSKVRCRHLRCTDRCRRISRPIVSIKRKWNRPLNRCFHFSTKSLKSRTKPPLEPSKCK